MRRFRRRQCKKIQGNKYRKSKFRTGEFRKEGRTLGLRGEGPEPLLCFLLLRRGLMAEVVMVMSGDDGQIQGNKFRKSKFRTGEFRKEGRTLRLRGE